MNGETPFFVGENPLFQLVKAVSYGSLKKGLKRHLIDEIFICGFR